ASALPRPVRTTRLLRSVRPGQLLFWVCPFPLPRSAGKAPTLVSRRPPRRLPGQGTMPMDTRIKQAGLDELDKVVPLFDNYRIFYGQDSDVEAARQFLLSRMAHGESVILLAWRGRQAVGFS